jgi:hypothetical protein
VGLFARPVLGCHPEIGHLGLGQRMGPQRFHQHHVNIGRGDKIRTCDPLHPMDSGLKRDATRCYGLHRSMAVKMPCFIGFSALIALRVASQRRGAYPPQSVPKVYLKLTISTACPDPLSAGSPVPRSKTAA